MVGVLARTLMGKHLAGREQGERTSAKGRPRGGSRVLRRFGFDRQLAVCVNSPVKNARPGALSRRGTSFPS
jgi:hypothetical protein